MSASKAKQLGYMKEWEGWLHQLWCSWEAGWWAKWERGEGGNHGTVFQKTSPGKRRFHAKAESPRAKLWCVCEEQKADASGWNCSEGRWGGWRWEPQSSTGHGGHLGPFPRPAQNPPGKFFYSSPQNVYRVSRFVCQLPLVLYARMTFPGCGPGDRLDSSLLLPGPGTALYLLGVSRCVGLFVRLM